MTENILEIRLKTDHLLLVPVSSAYREQIFQEFSPEITVFMSPAPAKKIEDTDAFINSSTEKMQKGEEIVFAVLKKETEEFLGCAGLHHIDTKQPELGIWIKKSAHGSGYGKEAMEAVKKWVDENLDYEYIYYPVGKDNWASRRIPESMGGKVVGELVGTKQDGTTFDEVEYRIYTTISRASLVVLLSKDNKVFLQMRAKDDDSYGGCWDASAGGGIEEGETPEQAAHRELQEEVGVSTDLQFIAKELFVFSEEDKEWMYIYTGQYDGEFIPNKKEVERVEAFSFEELREMVKDERQFHPEGLYILKKYILKDV